MNENDNRVIGPYTAIVYGERRDLAACKRVDCKRPCLRLDRRLKSTHRENPPNPETCSLFIPVGNDDR